MTDDLPIRSSGPAAPKLTADQQRLKKAAHEFEGVFLAQLFKEMRATVPAEDGMPGEEMFTEMLDDTMANEAAGRSTRGLGEALYRQLAARLEGAAGDRNGTVDLGRT